MLNVKVVLNTLKESGRDLNIILNQWMKSREDEEETVNEEDR